MKGSFKSENKSKSEGTQGKKKAKNKAGTSIQKDKRRSKSSVVSTKTKKTKIGAGSKKVKRKDSEALADVVVDPALVEVTEEDLREAEVWLLKYLEPRTKQSTLVCTLDTTMDNGERYVRG